MHVNEYGAASGGCRASRGAIMELTEKLTYVTVQIRCGLVDGAESLGTGFMFSYRKGEAVLPVLVTNKHVVKNAVETHISIPYFHEGERGETRHSFNVVVGDGEKAWVMHPEDSIDLCALPLQVVINAMRDTDEKAQYVSLDESLVPTQEELEKLSPFEDVIMIGYPVGLIDQTHNAPLTRRGITATHPKFDFNDRPLFFN